MRSIAARRLIGTGLCTLCLSFGLLACGEEDSDGQAPPSADAPSSSSPSPDTPTTSPPQDPPDGPATIPDLPVNKDPSAVTCTGRPEGVFDATSIIGQSEAEAADAAAAEGCAIRVVERDGRSLAVTDDFRPDRINVAVEDAVVTKIVSLG